MKAPASPLFERFAHLFLADTPLTVLDVACGSGRNGAWFLARGHEVCFLDFDLQRLEDELKQHTRSKLLARDLETPPQAPLGQFDLVLVFNYLHRPLFALLEAAVKPGGLLIYETFTHQQAQIGRPRNPDFLLEDAELKQRFAHWQQVYYGEQTPVEGEGAFKASIICRKPMD